MALNSVNTNSGAMIALQNLQRTNAELATVQDRINTGRKVNSAKDNGAVWAIAQSQRAEVSSLNAVKDSLQRGQSAVDVAISAGESISDLLIQLKEKALAAKDTSIDTAARTALNEDFKSIRDQIAKVVSNAEFNGVNMLKSGGTTFKALANADGSSTIDVAAEVLKLSGSKSLETHLNFVSKLQDTLEAGVGNLVDADLAKESARLQALQTKQQLGVQALSIANSSSSILLGLFR